MGIIYLCGMPDAHKKRQKQIRMSDETRLRFEAAQKNSGLSGEAFIKLCLDALEGQGALTKKAVIAWLDKKIPTG